MAKRRWRLSVRIACLAVAAGLAILAQACGGGSASEDASPTATNPPAAAAGDETPLPGFTPGAGPRGQALSVGGASEELAAFLGVSTEQLQSELDAEGATPASVAEAHGRTRDELKTFYTEQQEGRLTDAVAGGTMSQDDADQMLEDFASRVDDMIDGNVRTVPMGGGPGAGAITSGDQGLFIAGPSDELAEFLGTSLEQLESEFSADGATPASVAEAHGRTRDELKIFYTEQLQTQMLDAVAAGTMSVEDADRMIEGLTSRIDDIIDGRMPSGGPPATPFAP